MQSRPLASSPPPLWAINQTSSAATVPTTPDLTLLPKVSEIMQKKSLQTKLFRKLSTPTIPSSPISSPDPQSSANPFSSTSTLLSLVPGKHRAGLPDGIDSYHTIECYDRITNKVHASKTSTSDTEPRTELHGTVNEVPDLSTAVTSFKPQKVSIQPITLTHKYQENKHSRYPKKRIAKHNDTSSSSGSRSHGDSPSSGNSTGDLNVVGISSSAKSVSATTEVTTLARRSPLATHSMLNATVASLPAIPQPFPLPIMFHPTFTPTTPGIQLPFVYPSLIPFGISSPLSALQQFSMLQQSHPNHYTMVDCPTFVWPPSSKVPTGTGFNFMMPNSSVLQTPPSSALQEDSQTRKRCTPPPVVDGDSQATSNIPEPSPKKARPDFVSTSASNCLPKVTNLNSATLSTIPAASITRHNKIPIAHHEMDTSHNSITDDGSNSESEMKDNGDSDSEDDVVTCPQEPASIEGTSNLPPCKSANFQ